MDVLTRFGRGNTLYTFPSDSQVAINDNFAELVTRTNRLPGADGGFDDLGDGRGLSEIGSVSANFWLNFDGRGDATADIDSFRKMQAWGVQQLFKQPADLSKSERWCWARVDNISTPRNAAARPHVRLNAAVTFQVADPFWYTAGNGVAWGSGVTWGGGTKWGVSSPTAASGLSTTTTITYNGNAYTQPLIVIRPAAGQSCVDPIVRRLVNGMAVDEFSYYGTLNALDCLVVNCRKGSVRLNDAAAYSNSYKFKHPAWMRLLPGSNTLEIKFAYSTNAAAVTILYYERYV